MFWHSVLQLQHEQHQRPSEKQYESRGRAQRCGAIVRVGTSMVMLPTAPTMRLRCSLLSANQ